MNEAACKGATELFVPHICGNRCSVTGYCIQSHEPIKDARLKQRERIKEAVNTCQRVCPVYQECYQWVRSQPYEYIKDGIVAGLTPRQRHKRAFDFIETSY